jgi:hypothetical protein
LLSALLPLTEGLSSKIHAKPEPLAANNQSNRNGKKTNSVILFISHNIPTRVICIHQQSTSQAVLSEYVCMAKQQHSSAQALTLIEQVYIVLPISPVMGKVSGASEEPDAE